MPHIYYPEIPAPFLKICFADLLPKDSCRGCFCCSWHSACRFAFSALTWLYEHNVTLVFLFYFSEVPKTIWPLRIDWFVETFDICGWSSWLSPLHEDFPLTEEHEVFRYHEAWDNHQARGFSVTTVRSTTTAAHLYQLCDSFLVQPPATPCRISKFVLITIVLQ